CHENGLYELVGRSKELIISGGENIHPAEIENLVAERPEVAECAVVGLPDAHWGEVPVLAVVARPGAALDAAALLASLEGRIARFKQPQRVVELEAFPKTALGKVQRAELVLVLSERKPPQA
ncbi:MAG: long-chain fatty acid--CoA ligase, partial [Burkholderiales bacterium]|nr:long-chain fatty acid--CoA ligase [Burkholderiales bacterium]